jgi:hypothetical protein
MIGYQYLLDQLRAEIATIPMVNTITQGALDDIDNYKQSIFPVVHLIVNSVSPSSNTLEFNISIVAMDVVDISKDETTDKFYGNDNEIYVLNTTLAILVRIIDVLRRGSLSDKNIELTGTAALEPFTERFENYLAGWTATVSILVPNEMSIC